MASGDSGPRIHVLIVDIGLVGRLGRVARMSRSHRALCAAREPAAHAPSALRARVR